MATEAHATTLTFPRDMDPVDYLMFRGEQDPRSRSANAVDRVPRHGPRLRTAARDVRRGPSRVVLRLRQRVVVPALPIGSAKWIVDPDFDLSYHVRRGAPARAGHDPSAARLRPADPRRALRHGAPAVGGLPRGRSRRRRRRAALVLKMNHAVTDGVGGVELARLVYDAERDTDRGPLPPMPVPEDVSPTELVREALRHAPFALVGGAIHRVRRGVSLGTRRCAGPGRAAGDVGKLLGSAQRVIGGPPAPPSPLLRRRSLGRRFEWLEFPLDRFRRAAKAAGGSVNDAYIAGICGALRLYHDELGVPIDAMPLAMPVNLRSRRRPRGWQPLRRRAHRRARRRARSGAAHRPDPRAGAHRRLRAGDQCAERGRAGVARFPGPLSNALASKGVEHRRAGEQRPRLPRAALHRRREVGEDVAVRTGARRRDDDRAVHRGRDVLRRHQLRHRIGHRSRPVRALPARRLRRGAGASRRRKRS